MSRDINLLSYVGPVDSGRTVDLSGAMLVPGAEMADTLKFTGGLTDFTGRFGIVVGGREDCVDVNDHAARLRLHAELFRPRGKYLTTIKGGAREIHLSGEVEGHGREVDIDIGNLSEQSDDATGPVYLDLRHRAGDPITVRILNGSRPVLLNRDVQRYETRLRVPPVWGRLFARCGALLKALRNSLSQRIP